MSDVTTRPAASIAGGVGTQDRRRPGRMENPSPELIALMRKPTPQAVQALMLYDAPNFVLPEGGGTLTSIKLYQLVHFAMAFGVCAAGWILAFRVMMGVWG